MPTMGVTVPLVCLSRCTIEDKLNANSGVCGRSITKGILCMSSASRCARAWGCSSRGRVQRCSPYCDKRHPYFVRKLFSHLSSGSAIPTWQYSVMVTSTIATSVVWYSWHAPSLLTCIALLLLPPSKLPVSNRNLNSTKNVLHWMRNNSASHLKSNHR